MKESEEGGKIGRGERGEREEGIDKGDETDSNSIPQYSSVQCSMNSPLFSFSQI